MNHVEELVESHARAIRDLSRKMDRRSEALRVWSGAKTNAAVENYRKADADYNAAAAEVLRLRIAIGEAHHNFQLEARFEPLPASKRLERR